MKKPKYEKEKSNYLRSKPRIRNTTLNAITAATTISTLAARENTEAICPIAGTTSHQTNRDGHGQGYVM